MMNNITALRGYLRQGNFPLDSTSVFETLKDAEKYVKENNSAYLGQFLAVVDFNLNSVRPYIVILKDNKKVLSELIQLESGNITDTLSKIQEIIGFFNNLGFRVEDEKLYLDKELNAKKIKVETSGIIEDNDVVNLEYLNRVIKDSPSKSGIITFKMNKDGGSSSIITHPEFLIKNITVKIDEPFEAPISIVIGNDSIVEDKYIVESEKTTSLIEINETVIGERQFKAVVKGNSNTGSGEVIILYKG